MKVYYCKKGHKVIKEPMKKCRACDSMLRFKSRDTFMNWGFNRENWNYEKLAESDKI